MLYWSNEAIFDAGRAREFVNELSILFRFNSVRFTKNLSPNKISVKFLKGEGELHNLELDETTLAELLELPPWIRLTKATCNRISAKVKSFSLALVVTFFFKIYNYIMYLSRCTSLSLFVIESWICVLVNFEKIASRRKCMYILYCMTSTGIYVWA